jgi:hypothetical protein
MTSRTVSIEDFVTCWKCHPELFHRMNGLHWLEISAQYPTCHACHHNWNQLRELRGLPPLEDPCAHRSGRRHKTCPPPPPAPEEPVRLTYGLAEKSKVFWQIMSDGVLNRPRGR